MIGAQKHHASGWLSNADRAFLRALPMGLLTGVATLALFWPLRHDGEMIWMALAGI